MQGLSTAGEKTPFKNPGYAPAAEWLPRVAPGILAAGSVAHTLKPREYAPQGIFESCAL